MCKMKNSCNQAFARKHYIGKKAASTSLMIIRLKTLSQIEVGDRVHESLLYYFL